MKCWICGTEYYLGDCPQCGPAMPWGPTPDELAQDDKREEPERYWYWDDNDYAEQVCQKRWGPL